MNKEEYESKKNKLQEKKITKEVIDNSSVTREITDDDIDKMITQSKEIINEDEKITDDELTELKEKATAKAVSKVPELKDFMKKEEFVRLGTNARIPVILDLNGYSVKVFIRALSRREVQECRLKAENTKEDADTLCVEKACTDSDGNHYPVEVLEQLGFGRIQELSEAIAIASGESRDNTTSAIREQVIDNFLQELRT